MFDFIRKKEIWQALDNAYLTELENKKISFQLKTMQDLAVYQMLRDARGAKIAEIGGGNSRILKQLAQNNACFNIERFEGNDNGPAAVVEIPGVTNILCYVGDFDPQLEAEQFDVAFSISVVEHIVDDRLDAFHRDLMRILKPGGMFIHAIDIYVEDEPSDYFQQRFSAYRTWVEDGDTVEPLGELYAGPLKFSCSMASNPDNTMHAWGTISPKLIDLRTEAQNVSILVAGRKKPASNGRG
ncbi:MAG: class I SAM-dependent methyltransferase [Methyloligella sp. ZOD6]